MDEQTEAEEFLERVIGVDSDQPRIVASGEIAAAGGTAATIVTLADGRRFRLLAEPA
jgi:hypothetical protein